MGLEPMVMLMGALEAPPDCLPAVLVVALPVVLVAAVAVVGPVLLVVAEDTAAVSLSLVVLAVVVTEKGPSFTGTL